MKKSSYAAYKKFCDIETQQARSVSREAQDGLEEAEESLSRAMDRLQRFDLQTASMTDGVISAAEWRLVENQRRLLSTQVEAGHRHLARQRTQLSVAQGKQLEADFQAKRCERFGERMRAADRRKGEKVAQRELDEIGLRLASRRASR